MIIRFSIENFLSFGERTVFSMVPGLIRSHENHKTEVKSAREIAVLKLGMLYGPNASGKSNFVKALEFMQDLVVSGTKAQRRINLMQNKLAPAFEGKPSRLEIEFRKNDASYAYGFIITEEKVIEEWLYEITRSGEKPIFERKPDSKGEDSFAFTGMKDLSRENKEFIHFLARGTRSNQLFLTECHERNAVKHTPEVPAIQDALEWFSENLQIIFPDSQYMGLISDSIFDNDFKTRLMNYIRLFDTSIDDIELTSTELSSLSGISEEIKQRILDDAKEKLNGQLQINESRYAVTKNERGEIVAYKMQMLHKTGEKTELFEMSEESDGTRRLFDLLPALIQLGNATNAIVIDEIDRSLHANLTRRFIQLFIETSGGRDCQLITTTHDTNLLDLKLLRKDEIWFVEKDKLNQSKFFSLNDFNIRFDKQIMKDYLLGRYGAIPFLK